MGTNDWMRRLFAHMDWADRRLLALLVEGEVPAPPDAMRLLSHVLAAERVWLMRLEGRDTLGESIWPALPPNEIVARAAENRDGYARYLAALGEGDLEREVAYTNQQGKPFRSAVGDILTQVAMHGSYHRGQIATSLRAAGGEPVNTDYITFARETGETR